MNNDDQWKFNLKYIQVYPHKKIKNKNVKLKNWKLMCIQSWCVSKWIKWPNSKLLHKTHNVLPINDDHALVVFTFVD